MLLHRKAMRRSMPPRWKTSTFWVVMSVGVGSLLTLQLPGGFTVRLVDALWSFLAVSLILRLVMGKRLRVLRIPAVLGAFYWVYFGARMAAPMIAVSLGAVPITEISSTLRYAMMSTLPYLLSGVSQSEDSATQGFELALILSIILNGIYAVLQELEFAGVIPFGSLPHHLAAAYVEGAKFDKWWRATGLFANMNELAWFGMTAGLVLVTVGLNRGNASRVLVGFLGVSLSFLANSRASLVSFIVAMVLMGLAFSARSQRGPFRLWFASTVSATAAGVIAILFVPQLERIARGFAALAKGTSADSSLALRVNEYWVRGVDVFLRYPLGYGGDPTIPAGGPIDSAWLTSLAQGGLMLVVAFGGLLIASTAYGLTGGKSGRLHYGLALACLSVTVAVGSIALAPLGYPSVMVVYLSVFMLAVRERRSRVLVESVVGSRTPRTRRNSGL